MPQLSLMQFSQKTVLTDYGHVTVARQAVSQPDVVTYPLTITWPANSPVGVIEGQWLRLADGQIKATYLNWFEYKWCVEVGLWANGKDLADFENLLTQQKG